MTMAGRQESGTQACMEEKLQAVIAEDAAAKPEIRWWLAGGSHTDETLLASLEDIRSMGFGGIEMLTMAEEAMDRSVYGWDSPSWYQSTKLLLEKCTEYSMAFSFTSGPNWQPAVPGISLDSPAAAQELNFDAFTVPAGATVYGAVLPCRPAQDKPKCFYLKTVAARLADRSRDAKITPIGSREASLFPAPGSAFETVYLAADSAVDLTDRVRTVGESKFLTWTAPADGSYAVFSFWYHATAQQALASYTPAWVINHLDRAGFEAQRAYWDAHFFTDEICRLIRENGRVNFFQDSLEIMTSQFSGLYWSADFLREFRQRRGYDLTLLLPMVIQYSIGFITSWVTREAEKPRFLFEGCEEQRKMLMRDVYQTQTELYQENYLEPIRHWLNGYGIQLRAQASYGFPTVNFEISEPAASVDILETETLEMADEVDYYRTQSGGVHLTGKTIFSAETGATNGGNYYLTPQHYLLKIHRLFAGGVNRVIFHGYAAQAGPEGAMQWPGYEALHADTSERWGARQPYGADLPALTGYLTRMQSVLRRGCARIDVGILNLTYTSVNMDFWYGAVPDPQNHLDEVFSWADRTLNDAGYTYEFFSPKYLENPEIRCENGEFDAGRTGCRALIVSQPCLSLRSAEALLQLAGKGMPVVLLKGAAAAPAFLGDDPAALAAVTAQLRALPCVAEAASQQDAVAALQRLGVAPRISLQPSAPLMMLQRSAEEAEILFALNPGKTVLRTTLHRDGVWTPYRYNAWTGEPAPAAGARSDGSSTALPVELQPEEAALYIWLPGMPPAAAPKAETVQILPVSNWKLDVESWAPGEKHVRTQGEKAEVYFDTEKTHLTADLEQLLPWKDIPGIGPAVSGIGYYAADFTLPADLQGCRVSIDFGTVMGTISAAVNGQALPPLDLSHPAADITASVRPGENHLQVKTASTLGNRMIALGRMRPDTVILKDVKTEISAYGLTETTIRLHRQ